MGTNVYLEWIGKTPIEDEKQLHAKSCINSGNVGYLWASIHMVRENAVLRLLFPEKYWQDRSKDEYDFKAGIEKLRTLGREYLQSIAEGREMNLPEEVLEELVQMKRTAEAITQALKNISRQAGRDEAQVYCGKLKDIGSAGAWLKSLLAFFRIGIKMQEQTLKPYPRIDW